MKGIIIVNRSGFSAQEYQARRIEEELSALGVSTETISDGYRLFGIKDGKCHGFSAGEKPDFAVFLDKQIVELTEISAVGHILARVFQNVLGKRLQSYRRSGLFGLGFFGFLRENNHTVSADKLRLAVDKTRETL